MHRCLFSLQFELLFCIQEESDPSIMLVKRLMEKYPKVDARIFIGKLRGLTSFIFLHLIRRLIYL